MKRVVQIAIIIIILYATAHWSPAYAARPYGFVGNITSDGQVTGWAQDLDAPDDHIDVAVYIDGPYPTGTFIGTTKANLSEFNLTYGFRLLVPQLKDNKPHSIYVYGVDPSGTTNNTLLLNSPQTYPMDATGVYYNEPNYPESSGWGADTTNYFTQWQCTSTTGINGIYRLDIASLGKHSSLFWKDSLFVNNVDYVDGAPVVYFTAGLTSSIPKFSLKKAIYNKTQNKWQVSDVLNHPNPILGGFSSQDGIGDDYILNEYGIPGWGPTSHKPGSASKIPGVSNTPTASGIASYPLVGSGSLGLTTITNLIQNNAPSDFNRCIHMNPTLFDFDSTGIPHSMAVYLFTTQDTASACKLPSGEQLPHAGYYVYHYVDNTRGWQLDTATGLIDGTQTSVLNYIYGSNKQFMGARYDGTVQTIDLTKPAASRVNTVLDCSKSGIHMAEGSGQPNQIFFLGMTQEATMDQLPNLDIYYAFNTNLQPSPTPFPGDYTSDQHVNNDDITRVTSHFGNPYTIFDYNSIVENFGK